MQLVEHARRLLSEGIIRPPEHTDYFSWGRDPRHQSQNDEVLPERRTKAGPLALARRAKRRLGIAVVTRSHTAFLWRFRREFEEFDSSYQLMSDDWSRQLFAELLIMKLVSEHHMTLTPFTRQYVDTYELASKRVLDSPRGPVVFGTQLYTVAFDDSEMVVDTVPVVLNLHLCNRLYRYERGGVTIETEPGDVVIDCGVGWGDTCVFMAARAYEGEGAAYYAFEIMEEGLESLERQFQMNASVDCTAVKRAVSNVDGDGVYVSESGPGSRVVEAETSTRVETITIDTFVAQQGLERLSLIKMDIEGSEVPALRGAAESIRRFKPKLAISAYHKWDDLLVIPRLISSIRPDYQFFLECTTGFGGEAVLYCR